MDHLRRSRADPPARKQGSALSHYSSITTARKHTPKSLENIRRPSRKAGVFRGAKAENLDVFGQEMGNATMSERIQSCIIESPRPPLRDCVVDMLASPGDYGQNSTINLSS